MERKIQLKLLWRAALFLLSALDVVTDLLMLTRPDVRAQSGPVLFFISVAIYGVMVMVYTYCTDILYNTESLDRSAMLPMLDVTESLFTLLILMMLKTQTGAITSMSTWIRILMITANLGRLHVFVGVNLRGFTERRACSILGTRLILCIPGLLIVMGLYITGVLASHDGDLSGAQFVGLYGGICLLVMTVYMIPMILFGTNVQSPITTYKKLMNRWTEECLPLVELAPSDATTV